MSVLRQPEHQRVRKYRENARKSGDEIPGLEIRAAKSCKDVGLPGFDEPAYIQQYPSWRSGRFEKSAADIKLGGGSAGPRPIRHLDRSPR